VTAAARGRRTGWPVLAEQECRDLWIGGRGPVLMFAYSVLLSSVTYLAATNQGLNFLEQREAVNLVLQVAVTVGVLVTLLISADAISGERERGTLESLLLAPVARRAIVTGKLAGALSLWFACVLVSVPYLWVLGRGVSAVRPAVLLAIAVGTVVAVGLAGLGLLVSSLSSSNKVSLATSLFVLLALFAPTQLPGMSKSWIGDLLIRVNPLGSAMHYSSQILLSRRTWTQELDYLVSPVLAGCLAVAVLAAAGNRLVRLTGGVSGE
jgi:ABC-2 type transport system permease protein